MRKDSINKLISLLLCLLLLLSFAGCGNNSKTVSNSPIEESQDEVKEVQLPKDVKGPYMVERVVDGDTFIALVEGERVRIRILCIDTPESVAPEETGKKNTDEGAIASDRAKELLTNKNVYLEYDKEKKDQYDRVLAYVYFEDGTRFEDIMISEGLAKVVYYEPNVKYKDELYELQDKAKKDKTGFWGTGFYK